MADNLSGDLKNLDSGKDFAFRLKRPLMALRKLTQGLSDAITLRVNG
jgi:hypothetical protein